MALQAIAIEGRRVLGNTTIGNLEYIISQWLRCINKYYELNEENNDDFSYTRDIFEFKDDIDEFVKANKALLQEQTDNSIIQFHSQACYTSRLLTDILDQNSECLDCIINN